MRGPFRYIADERLATMSAELPWWRRLRGTVKAGVPTAQLEATVAPSDSSRADRIIAIERVLQRKRRVRSPRDVLRGDPEMFSFEGPAAMASADGAFWTATLTDECAVLLVGSLKHAIGGVPPETITPGISPSVDPRPAVAALLEGRIFHMSSEINFAEAWQEIVDKPQIAPFLELSAVRGIAEYRTRVIGDALTVWRDEASVRAAVPGGAPVLGLVVGAPLWIEAA